jgi:hypothetical protein
MRQNHWVGGKKTGLLNNNTENNSIIRIMPCNECNVMKVKSSKLHNRCWKCPPPTSKHF